MKSRDYLKFLVGCLGLAAVSATQAAVISLNFEDIAPYPNNNDVYIQDYYNGGTASNGNTGLNSGISFSSNALLFCLNSTSVTCSNTSRGGLDPTSAQGAMLFLSNGDASVDFIDVAAGFDAGFSFNYVSDDDTSSVSVFDGLGGTGALLAMIDLSSNTERCDLYNAGFCPFSPIGVAFAGTARSVSFAGFSLLSVFDDVTFGSVDPGVPNAMPAPATLALLGMGLAGLGWSRRKKT